MLGWLKGSRSVSERTGARPSGVPNDAALRSEGHRPARRAEKTYRHKSDSRKRVELLLVIAAIAAVASFAPTATRMLTEIRDWRVARDLHNIASASRLYFETHGAWPGDDKGAAARWGPDHACPFILNCNNGRLDGDETDLFWMHLHRAGFLPGDFQSVAIAAAQGSPPGHVIGGSIVILKGRGTAICADGFRESRARTVHDLIDTMPGTTGYSFISKKTDGVFDPRPFMVCYQVTS